MQTGEPLKPPLDFQCLSCTHCVLQISKHPAARFGTRSGMSSVHAGCSWLAYAQATQLLMAGASLVPCGITGTGDLPESSESKCSFSLCMLVQEKAVSLGCSKCFVPNPGTPPHHWDGQVGVDSLIPASCWTSACHIPVQSRSTGRKVRRRRDACSWQGIKWNHGLSLNHSVFRGKLKGIPEYTQCCEGPQCTSHKTSWGCGGLFLKRSRGLRVDSVVFYLLHVLEKALGAQLTWVMILEKSQRGNTDSFPVRVAVVSQHRFVFKQGHHRINKVGRDFWREQGQLQQVAQGFVMFRFDYFQGWRLHSLCGQYHTVRRSSQGKSFSYI